MIRRAGYLVVFVAAMLIPARAQCERRPDEIPFKLIQGFGIIVQGEVGVQGEGGRISNLNILFDTGAVPGVLSVRLARQMGVSGPVGSFDLPKERIQAEYVTVDDLRIGGIHAKHQSMVITDLHELEQLLGVRIDAIVGLELFAGQNFGIDYKHRKIKLGSLGITRHVTPIEIRTAAEAPYCVLPITINGQQFHVLLNTASNQFALFQGHTPRHVIDSSRNLRTLVPQTMQFVMGDMALNNQIANVTQEPHGALRELDGELGPTALHMSRIEFDWEHQCLRWDNE
jgi:hypothetical protein